MNYPIARAQTWSRLLGTARKIALPRPEVLMSDGLPPAVSCVYRIRCVASGKFYIGSTVKLRRRWRVHLRTVRAGTHHSPLLQAAWNKHCDQAFEISVLEVVEREGLPNAEQAWLDGSGCTDASRGFNVRSLASGGGRKFGAVRSGYIDPTGKPVAIVNLHRFCNEHELNFSAMRSLARPHSRLKSHKGWSHVDAARKRDYIKEHHGFIDPSGRPVGPIVNLAAFSREHGLDDTHMLAMSRGKPCSHKGWTWSNPE